MPERLSFDDQTIRCGNHEWHVPYPIDDARLIDELIVVLYQYMSAPICEAFPNLEAFSLSGKKLWTAELPNTGGTATYVGMNNDLPLIAWSFSCWMCEIDINTGRILQKHFTK